MKTTFLTLATLGSMLSFSSAFVITDCKSGKSVNFGDNKCQIWTGSTFTYESDAKCVLSVWSEGNCEGEGYQTKTQQTCLTTPFGATSIYCKK